MDLSLHTLMNTFSTHVFRIRTSVGDIVNDVIMKGKYSMCCELCEDSHRLLLSTKTGYRPGFVLRSGLNNGDFYDTFCTRNKLNVLLY